MKPRKACKYCGNRDVPIERDGFCSLYCWSEDYAKKHDSFNSTGSIRRWIVSNKYRGLWYLPATLWHTRQEARFHLPRENGKVRKGYRVLSVRVAIEDVL